MKTNLLAIRVPLMFFLIAGVAIFLASRNTMAQDTGDSRPFKILFLGDSITEAGVQPNGYVTQVQQALAERHKDVSIEIIGKGISGNKVPDLIARLERDVLSHNPDLVVIYIGINDVWHSQGGTGTPIDQFESGLKSIVESVQRNGSKVILCTPSVIGEKTDGTNPLDPMLEEYSAATRKLVGMTGLPLVDLRSLFLHDLRIINPNNTEQGIYTTDGVHLNGAGNEFVKDCMLPAIESAVTARVLKHVVLVKFKPTTRVAEINRLVDAFANLEREIDVVSGFEFGSDVSPEGLNQGYTHAFVMGFRSAADRDIYLVHPAHQRFVDLVKPHFDSVAVIDFWTR